MVKKLRINEQIRVPEVRLVGKKGEQLGIMSVAEALDMARKNNIDLVEVAPMAAPPVCRLLDYGKYKYEQAKKERELRKSQKASDLREIRLRPKIGDHDFEAKARSVKKLLEEGDKVKVTVMFRGREITHPDIGWRLLQRMVEVQKATGTVDRQPSMEERRMTLVLSPLAEHKGLAKEAPKKEEPKEEPGNA